MGRPPRRDSETGIFHVMNRGVDRQAIFRTDADRIDFGRRLADVHERFEVEVLAYCLMSNHFHLVVKAPPGVLPESMHLLTSGYAHGFNARHDRVGHLFGSRYLAIPVETDEYLAWVVRYVHLNPLDLPGVQGPADHRWSSYPIYGGLRRAPTFVDTGPVLALFGGRVEDLVAFTEGDEAAWPAGPTATDLARLVESSLAIHDLARNSSLASSPGVDKTIVGIIAARESNVSGPARIALPARPAKAEQEARRRARRRLAADAELAEVVTWIERQAA